jgi:DNA helicase-2/ATP-dependent DNA helicase PcrA
MQDCFNERQAQAADPEDPEDTEVTATLRGLLPALVTGNGAEAAAQILALSRKRPRWRLFRSELWRDAERAIAELAANRAENMAAATDSVRQRTSASGRKLPKRTVSTPLLLKGLEFDHVIIPDATHFANEQSAQAKLFYVAISRATQSLTISSSQRIISFPIPNS